MVEIYDIETYKYAFIVCSLNRDTLKKYTFEVSFRKNDTKKLLEHLKNIKGQIGFNNLNFDYPIIHWFINNAKKYTHHELPEKIYNESQRIIKETFSSIHPKEVKIKQLDLFKIWHFDNKARRTSLKYLEFTMRSDNIEDLPYSIENNITSEQIDKIIEYCHHDVSETYKFYKITIGETELPLYKGKNKVKFRQEMGKKFNSNFLNYSDVKIGEEINKLTYLKLTGKSWWDIKDMYTERKFISINKIIPSYIEFKDKNLQEFLKSLKKDYINCFTPKLEYNIKFANNTWNFMLGGIHTQDRERIIIPKNNQIFEEKDVSSMYPNKIITQQLYPEHLGKEWLIGYTANKDRRLSLKNLEKKTSSDIQEIEILKLAMNGGGYGKTGEKGNKQMNIRPNWQYDPLVKYTTTIQCQLDILILADMLWETKVVEIESGNTDGINILYDNKYYELIESICKKWEQITSAELETTKYSKLIRTSVNDYMAIKNNGKCKLKGDFEIDKELHKNDSYRIIPIAIYEYFVNNTPIKETILNHKNIFDFCAGVRARKTAKKGQCWFELHSIKDDELYIEKLSKTVRYFISKKGKYLIKKYEDGSYSHVEAPKKITKKITKDWKITYFNKKFDVENFEDYNIDYPYYISKVREWITEIEDTNQLKLFQ